VEISETVLNGFNLVTFGLENGRRYMWHVTFDMENNEFPGISCLK